MTKNRIPVGLRAWVFICCAALLPLAAHADHAEYVLRHDSFYSSYRGEHVLRRCARNCQYEGNVHYGDTLMRALAYNGYLEEYRICRALKLQSLYGAGASGRFLDSAHSREGLAVKQRLYEKAILAYYADQVDDLAILRDQLRREEGDGFYSLKCDLVMDFSAPFKPYKLRWNFNNDSLNEYFLRRIDTQLATRPPSRNDSIFLMLARCDVAKEMPQAARYAEAREGIRFVLDHYLDQILISEVIPECLDLGAYAPIPTLLGLSAVYDQQRLLDWVIDHGIHVLTFPKFEKMPITIAEMEQQINQIVESEANPRKKLLLKYAAWRAIGKLDEDLNRFNSDEKKSRPAFSDAYRRAYPKPAKTDLGILAQQADSTGEAVDFASYLAYFEDDAIDKDKMHNMLITSALRQADETIATDANTKVDLEDFMPMAFYATARPTSADRKTIASLKAFFRKNPFYDESSVVQPDEEITTYDKFALYQQMFDGLLCIYPANRTYLEHKLAAYRIYRDVAKTDLQRSYVSMFKTTIDLMGIHQATGDKEAWSKQRQLESLTYFDDWYHVYPLGDFFGLLTATSKAAIHSHLLMKIKEYPVNQNLKLLKESWDKEAAKK